MGSERIVDQPTKKQSSQGKSIRRPKTSTAPVASYRDPWPLRLTHSRPLRWFDCTRRHDMPTGKLRFPQRSNPRTKLQPMGPVIKSFDVEGGQASKNAKAKHAGDIWPTSAPFQTRKPGIRFARVARRGGRGSGLAKQLQAFAFFGSLHLAEVAAPASEKPSCLLVSQRN